MSTDQMRNAVATVYAGRKWALKVKVMSDHQVLAIYKRFVNSKLL